MLFNLPSGWSEQQSQIKKQNICKRLKEKLINTKPETNRTGKMKWGEVQTLVSRGLGRWRGRGIKWLHTEPKTGINLIILRSWPKLKLRVSCSTTWATQVSLWVLFFFLMTKLVHIIPLHSFTLPITPPYALFLFTQQASLKHQFSAIWAQSSQDPHLKNNNIL